MAALTREDVFDAARMAFLRCCSRASRAWASFIICTSTRRPPVADPNLLSREILRAAHDVGIRIALLEGGLDARGGFRGESAGRRRARFTSAEQFLREAEALRVGVAAEFPADEAWLGVAPQSLAAVPIDQFKAIATTRTRNAAACTRTSARRRRRAPRASRNTVRPPSCCWLSTAGRQAVHRGGCDPPFDDEVKLVGTARASVAICPLTEHNLGRGARRWRTDRGRRRDCARAATATCRSIC